jgi:excisionase family DNA binding protein
MQHCQCYPRTAKNAIPNRKEVNDVHAEVRGRLLKVEEVAQALSVPPSWVYKQAETGEIPCIRVGRYLRFDLDEVMTWLRGGE